MKRKAVQAKHLPAEEILGVVALYNGGHQPPVEGPTFRNGPRWCLMYDLEERFPDLPYKVVLAKCRSLLKQGMLRGCGCGCRGDFEITPKGLTYLKEHLP
jgi:hypothetical protein